MIYKVNYFTKNRCCIWLYAQTKTKNCFRQLQEIVAAFLYQENHAIVAWFYRSFSDVFRQKTPNVYNKNVTCQLRK